MSINQNLSAAGACLALSICFVFFTNSKENSKSMHNYKGYFLKNYCGILKENE